MLKWHFCFLYSEWETLPVLFSGELGSADIATPPSKNKGLESFPSENMRQWHCARPGAVKLSCSISACNRTCFHVSGILIIFNENTVTSDTGNLSVHVMQFLLFCLKRLLSLVLCQTSVLTIPGVLPVDFLSLRQCSSKHQCATCCPSEI